MKVKKGDFKRVIPLDDKQVEKLRNSAKTIKNKFTKSFKKEDDDIKMGM